MDKVVRKGVKIDLHIHSVYSRSKDKDKVANNTLENLPGFFIIFIFFYQAPFLKK